MRVMTFNILLGGGEEARFGDVLAVIARARPDVLVLQECLGWEANDRLARVASTMGVPQDPDHCYLSLSAPRGSGRRFHVALLARAAFQGPVEHHLRAGVLAHSLARIELRFRGETLFVYGTHLSASDEDTRLEEVRYITSLGLPAPYCLLAGDLNALSRRDPYPADLPELLARAGTDKYGHPPRFDVISALEAAGWCDPLHPLRPAWVTPGWVTPAWVTAHRERGGVAIDYRTDYILASPSLRPHFERVEIVDVGTASDHQAVVATLA